MKIRVILVDDHQLLRDGLRQFLDRSQGIEVLGEAASGLEAVELAARLAPDVVVVDVGMSDLNGIELTQRIKGLNAEIQIVALSAFADRRYVLRMLEAGAAGHLQKSATGVELIRAIETVSQRKMYLGSDIANMVVDSYVNRTFPAELSSLSQLGEREREVLQHLAEGAKSKAIAAAMHISSSTVETHRRNIMKKLDLHNLADLTRYAIREGLISLEA